MDNRILKPEQIYQCCSNCPPDLLVYFDGLSRRSIGSVGGGALYRSGNDTGPDDANHDPEGIFIGARMVDLRSGRRIGRRVEDASCLDITPTILDQFGLSAPKDMAGRVINLGGHESLRNSDSPNRDSKADHLANGATIQGYTQEEEEIVKTRLKDLGYI